MNAKKSKAIRAAAVRIASQQKLQDFGLIAMKANPKTAIIKPNTTHGLVKQMKKLSKRVG